jgi:hypothetical protein
MQRPETFAEVACRIRTRDRYALPGAANPCGSICERYGTHCEVCLPRRAADAAESAHPRSRRREAGDLRSARRELPARGEELAARGAPGSRAAGVPGLFCHQVNEISTPVRPPAGAGGDAEGGAPVVLFGGERLVCFIRRNPATTNVSGQRVALRSRDPRQARGERVVLSPDAADRDGAAFACPHSLQAGRRPNPRAAFGFGPRRCPHGDRGRAAGAARDPGRDPAAPASSRPPAIRIRTSADTRPAPGADARPGKERGRRARGEIFPDDTGRVGLASARRSSGTRSGWNGAASPWPGHRPPKVSSGRPPQPQRGPEEKLRTNLA